MGEEQDEAGATHSKEQKENIPAVAVQDPSRTDHILFVICSQSSSGLLPQNSSRNKTQPLMMNKNPGIKQEREAEKVVEEAQQFPRNLGCLGIYKPKRENV